MGVKPKHARRRVRDTRLFKSFVRVAGTVGVLMLAASMTAAPASSSPGGSDDPTPYTVNAAGVTLPSGDVFPDGGHVNIKYTKNGGPEQGAGIHFESLNWPDDHPKKHYIGKSSIPWSVFGLSGDFCVTWVQVSLYNQHFGEGGQAPFCNTTPPPPSDECVPEYEWVKKATLWKYEHLKKVMKDQVKFKKQQELRTWKPGKDEVKEYRFQTRAWLQPSEHKQVKTTWRFGGSGTTVINGVSVPGTWSNPGGTASWYELPSAVTNAVWGPSGPPSNIVPPGSTESNPATGTVPLSTYGAPGAAGTVQYRAWLVPEGEWSGWSAWSAWSTVNPGPETETRRVESRIVQEATPGSWGPWGSSSWVTPHQVTEWLDVPVTEINMPGGPWVPGEWKFLDGDESKRYRYVQYDTRTVFSHNEVLGTDWFKKGEQPEGWTLVQPEKSKEVVVDGPLWSTTKPGDDWVKTGKERKVNCLVSPPVFNPGTCQAPGSAVADDTDTYTWSVTGPLSARVFTAVPRDGVTLTGQTVFGPYDLRQVDWKSDDCQPVFEVEQRCAYVKITFHNNSKWDRWPDYSFTGDTTEPTDFGSGPTWNTVKVAPGESKVIFERQFEEDYADGGPIEVWYQDILGAERDIDTPLVTLTVVTDCEANEVVPVLPEVTPQVCTPPNGDLTGGTIVLPEGPEGLEYAVYRDEVEVTDLTDLEPGDYQVVATIVEEHMVIPGSDVWTPSDDGQSATATVTVDAAEDCSVEKPPTPPTDEGEWTDVSSPVCGDTQVTQTRWVRTYADPVWDDVNQVWVEDKVGTVTEETRVRDLTPEELADLEEECTELPPPPEEPKEPKDKVKAVDVKFTDPTLVCKKGEWTEGDSGKVTIPKSEGVVYLIKNKAGKYVEIEAGTIGVDFEKVSVIAKAADKSVKLVGKTEWSHTFKPVKQGGGDCELATTGGEIAQAAGLAALLTLMGIGAVAVARRRNKAETQPSDEWFFGA